MNKAKKILMLVLCAALLVSATVAGTVAYLTSQAKVENTFTVGNVNITLQEYAVNAQTGEMDSNTIVDNLTNIELVPGRVIHKNPFITVGANSETCWLFVKIENGLGDVIQINEMTGWNPVDGHNGYYMYHTTVDAGSKIDVFTSITCLAKNGNDEMTAVNGKSIVITAYAVQSENVSQQAAWGALGQHITLN